jgi:hypothetical protein
MIAGAAAILDPDAEPHPARLVTLRRASNTLPIADGSRYALSWSSRLKVLTGVSLLGGSIR